MNKSKEDANNFPERNQQRLKYCSALSQEHTFPSATADEAQKQSSAGLWIRLAAYKSKQNSQESL